ncbi:MAG: response regulator transcription factor, partial [Eubacteriales bacterium]|nr:response regulator transcription factor [Eubacteriales bacterium]
MKIMLVEDDLEISKLLAEFLQEKGYEVLCQYDGLHVLDCLRENNIDLILLDIMLPYRNGDTVLTAVRECSTVPVIVISAKVTTQNKIDLLHLGADDYITKPFDMEEVLARIESNLRRVQFQKGPPACLRHGDLMLDLDDNIAFLQGRELALTAKEFAILELLMKYPDKIFSKANLFQSVWNAAYVSEDNTLNVHISNLRNKLKAV